MCQVYCGQTHQAPVHSLTACHFAKHGWSNADRPRNPECGRAKGPESERWRAIAANENRNVRHEAHGQATPSGSHALLTSIATRVSSLKG